MDASELLLGVGLIAVSALNSFAIIYLVHQRKTGLAKTEHVKEDEEGDADEREEQPEAAPGTERPTTKVGILAWRQSIIESLQRERGTKVITMIHKKELWTEPGEAPEIGIEDTVKVLMEIQKTARDKPIDMIIHTPGDMRSLPK